MPSGDNCHLFGDVADNDFDVPVAAINDGKDDRYPQPTPRARILAALKDLP